MTITSGGSIGVIASSGNNQGSSGLVPLATIAAGNLVVIVIAVDNNATTDGDEVAVSGVADNASGGSNTWTKAIAFTNSQGTAQTGATCEIWYSVLARQLLTSNTITISYNVPNSRDATAVTGWKFSLTAAGVRVAGTATQATDTSTTLGSLGLTTANITALRVRGSAIESFNNTNITATASWTAMTHAVSLTTGTSNLEQSVRAEFIISTGTTGTSNPTLTLPLASDIASAYAVFEETVTTSQAVTATGGSAATTARAMTFVKAVTATGSNSASLATTLIYPIPRTGVNLLTRSGPSGYGIRRGFTPPPAASTPVTIAASSGSTASVAFTSTRGVLIAAIGGSTASVLGITTHVKAITALGPSTVELSRLQSLSKLVAPVSTNSASVLYLPAIARTIAVSSGSTASVLGIRVNAKEIVAAGASTVSLVRQVLKSVAASSTSTASVSRVILGQRTIAPATGSTVDLGWQVHYGINATGGSSVSVAPRAAFVRQIAVSNGSSVTVSRQLSALRSIVAPGGSAATVGVVATKFAAGTAAGLGTASGAGNAVFNATGTASGLGIAPAINPGGGVFDAEGAANGTSTVSGFGAALVQATGTATVAAEAPFSPGDVGGLLVWVDIADAATLTTSGSLVSAIVNKGGVGGSFTQPDVDLRFTLVSTPRGPALNHVADFDPAPWMTRGVVPEVNIRDMTLFGVCTRPDTLDSGGFHMPLTMMDSYYYEGWNIGLNWDGADSQAQMYFEQVEVSGGGAVFDYSYAIAARTFASNRPFLAMARRSVSVIDGGITGDTHLNESGLDAYPPAAVVTSALTLGGLYNNNDGTTEGMWANGDLHEVLMFGRALSDVEVDQVEGYLAWKWGLQADLPVGHPYKSVAPVGAAIGVSVRGIGVGYSVATATGTAVGDGRAISIGFLASRGMAFGTSDAVGMAAGVNDAEGTALCQGTATGFMIASAITTGTSLGLGTALATGTGITAITGTALGTGIAHGAGGQITRVAGTALGTGSASAIGQQVSSAVGTAKGGKKGPFTPNSIANLALWLDVADTGRMTVVGGNKVAAIQSKGFQGGSFAQTNDAKRFTLVTTTNGPALQNLSASEDFWMSGGTAAYDIRDMTIFGAAFRSGSVGVFSTLLSRMDGPGNDGWRLGWAWIDSYGAYTTFAQTDASSGFSNTEMQAYASLDFNRAFMSGYRRGPAILMGDVAGNIPTMGPTPGSYTTPVGAYQIVLGGIDTSTGPTGKWKGNIHEVLLYQAQLTLEQTQQVEGYLAHKWKLDILWADHPYRLFPPDGPDAAAMAFAQLVTAGTGTAFGSGTASAIPGFMGFASGTATVLAGGASAAVGQGTVSGTSAVVGVGIAGSTGTAGGIGTATGMSVTLGTSIGTAAGTSIVYGAVPYIDPAPGTAFGLATVVGIGIATAAGTASTAGLGNAYGEGLSLLLTTGTTGGIGTATAVGHVVLTAVGTAGGMSTVMATSVSLAVSDGVATGIGSVAAIAVWPIVVFPTGVQAIGRVGNANVFWGMVDTDDLYPVGREIWEPIVV